MRRADTKNPLFGAQHAGQHAKRTPFVKSQAIYLGTRLCRGIQVTTNISIALSEVKMVSRLARDRQRSRRDSPHRGVHACSGHGRSGARGDRHRSSMLPPFAGTLSAKCLMRII